MRQPLFFSPVCDFVGDVLSVLTTVLRLPLVGTRWVKKA